MIVEAINFIKMDDIIYCQEDGKYTKFFLTNRNVCVSSKNLGDYALRVLDEGPFFSIHNSYVVIMRFVAQINKRDGMTCHAKYNISAPANPFA